jgi:hypothetical protein
MKYYLYLAAFILLVIYFTIILFKRRRRKLTKGIDYKAEGINIALGITKCKTLHKELVKLIHPDRINDDKKLIADQLIQNINAARYDYRKLVALKAEVIRFLNQ